MPQPFDWRAFFFVLCLLIATASAALVARATLQERGQTQIATPVVSTKSPVAFSTTTPQRIINTLTIADVIPTEGKFIAADLVHMTLQLYEHGTLVESLPIQTKGKPGTPWETPSGFYSIKTKERSHFSSIGKVYMPYSMQFYGNYFIHGWTYYPDGTPTSASFSGGCIKLTTDDAQRVFEFADIGTKVFVYDNKQTEPLDPLTMQSNPPAVEAQAYLVADIDTGDVYAEYNAQDVRPIASITKLMTALVANETISLDKKVQVIEGALSNPPQPASTTKQTFLVNDLFYPLLMQSSNLVADSLASYYGTGAFVRWMNATAHALGMENTTFADPSGISPNNLSSAEDLYRLAKYLAHKKPFVFKITRTPTRNITTQEGRAFLIKNLNAPANTEHFEGGKVGHTRAAQDTMLSVLSPTIDGVERRIAVIVLGSPDQQSDTTLLARWVLQENTSSQSACVSCATPETPRKIEP